MKYDYVRSDSKTVTQDTRDTWKRPYSEGWDAGYYGRPRNNPYERGWARLGGEPSAIAVEWEYGWLEGDYAAYCERAAEDESRKRDAREGFDE